MRRLSPDTTWAAAASAAPLTSERGISSPSTKLFVTDTPVDNQIIETSPTLQRDHGGQRSEPEALPPLRCEPTNTATSPCSSSARQGPLTLQDRAVAAAAAAAAGGGGVGGGGGGKGKDQVERDKESIDTATTSARHTSSAAESRHSCDIHSDATAAAGIPLHRPVTKPPRNSVAAQRDLRTVMDVSYETKTGGDEVAGEESFDSLHAGAPRHQLREYRQRLARDLEIRESSTRSQMVPQVGKARVSPIPEETMTRSPPSTAALATNSTEPLNTRCPAVTSGRVAFTPSYPFPRVATNEFASVLAQKSRDFSSADFCMPSSVPTEPYGVADKALSEESTPAASHPVHSSGDDSGHDGADYPSPDLSHLSLQLCAEPGLDAWWSTVVQIMKDVYKAERVTLAIPADTTDIENVPWGQKATYTERRDDQFSMGYLTKGSSVVPSNDCDRNATPLPTEPSQLPIPPLRPTLPSRHSFTAYESTKQASQNDFFPPITPRPRHLTRSQTHLSVNQALSTDASDYKRLDENALHEHDLAEERRSELDTDEPGSAGPQAHGLVLPVLQALDFEADPLIDHAGIMRVLQRGRPVTLTRTYPYLSTISHHSTESMAATKAVPKPAGSDVPKRPQNQRADSASKFSSILAASVRPKGSASDAPRNRLAGLDDAAPSPPSPKYEEFEQAPPSPWSQSPAPSPAVRADPSENPFFTDAVVDEASFNPSSAPTSYSTMRPPKAIGVDNSWTVLHVPLAHPPLPKPPYLRRSSESGARTRPGFQAYGHLDTNVTTTATERKKTSDFDRGSPSQRGLMRPAPIAVLSILSPLIPYPAPLQSSLEGLAPHMAASFSLCRHHTNLETELAGLQRRRPPTAGFGAVPSLARYVHNAAAAAQDEPTHQHSLAGSMTSPSDYSAISKSATGSPMGTPGWEQGSAVSLADRRHPLGSPAALTASGEGYFSSKQKGSMLGKQDSPGTGLLRPRAGSKDKSPGEKRLPLLSALRLGTDASSLDARPDHPDDNAIETRMPEDVDLIASLSMNASADPSVGPRALTHSERRLETVKLDANLTRQHGHSVLHSYGGDFSATFQSLPPSSSLNSRIAPTQSASSRYGSLTLGADMPPPSDRLKSLILDSLPAHVFVSLPQTGETVWVNSRYLSYRGQTVADLSADPWGSIHPDDRDGYLKAWSHSLRTGEQFSRTVRIKRFDGVYRWFYARAVASKDKRGVIMQFLGSYMDIHDQHIAELRAARQEEIEASEAKHRLLANLIPQIIFTATEDEGITFANEQWLSYTGQKFEDALNLGFLDYVHPDDLARCRIPIGHCCVPLSRQPDDTTPGHDNGSASSEATSTSETVRGAKSPKMSEIPDRVVDATPWREGRQPTTTGNDSEHLHADLTELVRKGVIKVTTDTNGRLSYTTEVRLRSKTGEYRWHLIRCVEIDIIDFGRGASSYFGSATDINDHKILETKLKEAMESKSRFLSNMSHEIRTPLIGISGMVTFLQDTTLDEEQRDYTDTIQHSANSLIMIINDILDLSKVDAGMMKLKYEWFHTRSVIEDVNELVSAMAIQKGLEVNYLVDADVPAWVKGDKVRLRQVLLNVIGNAIKFTSEGEVFSRCRVFTDGPSEERDHEIMLQFAVTDTGQGFSNEEAELIFKPFSQIDGSSTRQHGGSGLGLVISRQLVELHGGTMEGHAELGKGSTFTFTARFALPSPKDKPHVAVDPAVVVTSSPAPDRPRPQRLQKASPALQAVRESKIQTHAASEADYPSPSVVSTGSSERSVLSGKSHLTDRSSVSSVNIGLARFSEAAKASGQDLSQMKLEMPSSRNSPARRPTPEGIVHPPPDSRPPMYSILIICPQFHSREATAQHIEMTLPKEVPHQITALGTVQEAEKFLGGEDPINFTHIVLNLPSAEAIINIMDQISKSQVVERTSIVILSDSIQRQLIMKQAHDTNCERLLTASLVTFVYKPVKPSRFAVIFDPDKVRDLSTDRNRSTAQQIIESQKASYQEIERRMGNRGYRVLLVEDNVVNQKVLKKYLKKIGVDVDVAVDGAECTELVLSEPHEHYSLILCDLHMPRKDGYQACREIRQWERANGLPTMPIIALSANVMSDVQEKCVAAGFSDYVTKPVDFINLSRAMARFF